MAEPFPVSGNIDPKAFPHLLVDLHHRGATGSLKVVGPTHPKALYFRGGRILFGSSNDPKDQLGSILLESGRITRQQLDEVSAKVGPGRPLAKVLAESGFINQRELGDAARVKLERILADVLSWHSGSFEFEDGVLPKGAVDLKLSTEKLLLAAVRRIGDRGFALRHVALDSVLERHSKNDAALADIQADVQPLLEKIDGRRSLREAIALTRLDEFEAAKTACALLFLDVVDVRPEQAEVDLAEEAQSAFAAAEQDSVSMRVPLSAAEPEPFVLPDPQPPPLAFAAPQPQPQPQAPVMPSFVQAEPAGEPAADDEPMIVADTSHDVAPEAPTFILPKSPVASVPAPPPPPPSMAEPELPKTQMLRPRPPIQPPPDPEPEPEPEPPPAPPSMQDLPRPGRSQRPSQEDLAALDALLNPSAAATPNAGGSRDLAWATDSGEASTPPSLLRGRAAGKRSARVESGSRMSTRLLLIAVALGGVVIATVAAWYFLLRGPQPAPTSNPRLATARATPTPPATTMPTVPGPSPASQASAAPANPTTTVAPPTTAPAARPVAPTPTAPVATPTPAGRPTPAPEARPSASGGATIADARAQLARGALAEAAGTFSKALRPAAASRFTVQVLTACSPETVQKAIAATSSAQELFVLPVNVQGRSCYRVCWGLYDTRPSAETAAPPAYFRQAGVRPRVSGVAELLP